MACDTAFAVPTSTAGVSKLISRTEFRSVLKSVVRCLRSELNTPGLPLLNAEEIHFWFQNITLEDIETVTKELDAESQAEQEHPSRMQSMMQRIREKMRGSEGSMVRTSPKTSSEGETRSGSPKKPSE